MICWCTLCYGGVLYVMAVYHVLYVMAGVLYVRVVYCLLWRCTVCYAGVLCVMVVYCVVVGRCTVC